MNDSESARCLCAHVLPAFVVSTSCVRVVRIFASRLLRIDVPFLFTAPHVRQDSKPPDNQPPAPTTRGPPASVIIPRCVSRSTLNNFVSTRHHLTDDLVQLDSSVRSDVINFRRAEEELVIHQQDCGAPILIHGAPCSPGLEAARQSTTCSNYPWPACLSHHSKVCESIDAQQILSQLTIISPMTWCNDA